MEPAIVTLLATLATTFVICLALLCESSAKMGHIEDKM